MELVPCDEQGTVPLSGRFLADVSALAACGYFDAAASRLISFDITCTRAASLAPLA